MKVLRTRDVTDVTGLSRVTIWRLERAGDFPERIRLGQNSVGWFQDEIEAWLINRRQTNDRTQRSP